MTTTGLVLIAAGVGAINLLFDEDCAGFVRAVLAFCVGVVLLIAGLSVIAGGVILVLRAVGVL